MLILNAPLMANMSTDHLIASLRAEATPLTSTPAEMELLARLEAAEDRLNEADWKLLEVAEEYECSADILREYCEAHNGATHQQCIAMLEALGAADIVRLDNILAMHKVLDAEDIFTVEQLQCLLKK